MHPILFQLGPVAVRSHELFILLGVLAAAAVFVAEARRRGRMSDQMLWIVVGTLVGGAIFARAGALWQFVASPARASLADAIAHGGRSILGGLAGAYFGAVVTKRIVGYRRPTGDLFAPAVALGMAIGRWGCFLSEQIGTPTTLPWGIRPSPAVAASIPNCPYCTSGVAMHPSFLYEIAFHAAMFALLWWYLRPRVHAEGELFKIYLLAYAVFRFAVEFVRGNEVVALGLTRSQWFLIPSTLLLASYFVARRASPTDVGLRMRPTHRMHQDHPTHP